MDDLIHELKNLKSNNGGECHVLMNKNYSPIAIDKKNFHEIKEGNSLFELTFVDGGQAALFESAGFCIGFIRVAAITYSKNKRISRDIDEFFVLIKEDDEEFIVKTFPNTNPSIKEFDGIRFDPEDETIRTGSERATCTRILPIIRRLAELKLASKFENVILDGTLEARYPYELAFIKKLNNASALSKTCSLTTNHGLGMIDYLRNMDDGSWYYTPVVVNNNKNHPAEIYFVKLNEKSDYIFRFEHKMGTVDAEVVLEILKKNSIDPVFLGYPYGLVDADNAARVSEQEKKMLQMQISTKLGKEWDKFSKMLKSMNAHEILDNIKF